jgi:hypothetical protein
VHPGLKPFDPLRIANGIVKAEIMVRIVRMCILLRPRAPEAQDHPEVVFEEFRPGHLRPPLAEVDLGPILEARRLPGGWSFEPGRLAAHPALDLLFADAGVAPQGLSGGPDVPTTLKPEVVVEDVPRLNTLIVCRILPRHRLERNGSMVDQATKGNVAYRRAQAR